VARPAAPLPAQVVLPTSVERDVPDWFFNRTGQELKAAFLAAVRQREQSQVCVVVVVVCVCVGGGGGGVYGGGRPHPKNIPPAP
jgi:hypothetical protein